MVNLEFVRGLEKAKEILEARKKTYEEKIQEYEKISKGLVGEIKSLSSVLFYADILNDYRAMYRETKLKVDEIDYSICYIDDEIEKEMSIDADIEGESA